jgi:hypothetical protein
MNVDGRFSRLTLARLAGWARFLPAVVPCAFAAWMGFAGCAWDYAVATVDGGVETGFVDAATDAAEDAYSEYTLPDGRVCKGHDEDRDGIPDECDNCPNVGNPEQTGGAVGSACAPSTTFISSPERLLFDPFTSFTMWTPYGMGDGQFALGADGDSLAGGSAGGGELRFALTSPGAASSAMVVTTTVVVTEQTTDTMLPGPSAGIILRANGDPKHFYVCAVSIRNNAFAIARAPDSGCTGDLCAPGVLSEVFDGGSTTASSPIPGDVPRKVGTAIGIRASVTADMGDAGDGSGKIECRVFDPSNPATLTSTDAKYAVSVDLGGDPTLKRPRWYPSGDPGLYAQKCRAVFGSIDVVRGP